jgi:hypothetical protein
LVADVVTFGDHVFVIANETSHPGLRAVVEPAPKVISRKRVP